VLGWRVLAYYSLASNSAILTPPLAPSRLPLTPMVLIRNEEFDPLSRRLPPIHPAASIANGILDTVCSGAGALRDWESAQRAAGNPNFAGAVGVVSLLTLDNFCPTPSGTPPTLAPPIYPPTSTCASEGIVEGFSTYINQFTGGLVQTPTGNFIWNCSQNIGFPIGSPQKMPSGAGFTDMGIMVSRPVGAPIKLQICPGVPNDALSTAKFYILQNRFTPCPGCTDAPIVPQRPVIPAFPPDAPIIPRPEFPITINLPQLPGLPPIAIPIVYIPITPTLNLNLPLTFAPKFAPEFKFAPTIEINLGGISITGGGYSEPIPDVEELCPGGGGECPDPCTPTDYDLIRQITFEELDEKFPPARPFSLQTIQLPASNSRTFVLPPFTRYVNLTIVEPPPNVKSQFGGTLGQEVFYNGWYSFGATASSSERMPFHYNFMSIPIPPGVTQFTYTVYLGGTASVTIGYSVEG